MSKLHIFSKDDPTSHVADGDGSIDNHFTVQITSGKVAAGKTYYISQGTSVHREPCNCKTGADKNGIATFDLAHVATEATSSYLLKAQAVRLALAAATKTVSINIADADLAQLKANGYQLCFAKKVGGEYNVVWQSFQDYMSANTFSWTPSYSIFGTNQFADNVVVQAQTDMIPIGLGETITLQSNGLFITPAVTGGPDTSITLNNQYGAIHPGLNELTYGLDGQQVSTPIYVAPEAALIGPVSLEPVEIVQVWFEQSISTSTMFSDARTNAVEIDLTETDTATRLYTSGQWDVE